jgi:hypothetical protein
MDFNQAMQMALEASIDTSQRRYATVFGPRRTGTNYLQNLLLLNSLNLYCYKLEPGDSDYRMIINGYSVYGHKHSLVDVPLTQKLVSENINFVVFKRNLKCWLYSRIAFVKISNPDFRATYEWLESIVKNEIVDYLGALSSVDSSKYHLVAYEDIDIPSIRELLEKEGVILTQFTQSLNYTTVPGGKIMPKPFKKRMIVEDHVVEKFARDFQLNEETCANNQNLFDLLGIPLKNFSVI